MSAAILPRAIPKQGADAILDVQGIDTFYGETQALRDNPWVARSALAEVAC